MADDTERNDRPESRVDVATPQAQAGGPASPSRRALIRGASVAVPTILTLNSNAAMGWALSSNTIGTRAPVAGNKNGVLCLDTKGLPEVKPGVYGLGSPPYAEVYEIPSHVEYRRKDGAGPSAKWQKVHPQDVCVKGGVVQYKSGSKWNDLNRGQAIPRRAMVSSAACASFGNRVLSRHYKEL